MALNFFSGRKGQVANYFLVVVVLFVLSISYFVATVILSNFVTGFEASGFCADDSCTKAASGFLFALKLYDFIIILVLIALAIGVGLTSYRLPASPAFIVLSFIMAPFLGFVSYYFNFIFASMIGNGAFDSVRGFFPRTIFICTNFHWVALGIFIIGTLTLYAKRQQGSEGSFV